MRNLLILIATLIAIAHVGVPILAAWELPGQGITNEHAAAQLAEIK